MFDNLKNEIDFFIRNNFKISRKNFVEKNQNLIERNNMENNYTKDVLEKALKKQEKDGLKILDIGCKNWFYAKGEYDFFNSFCKNFTLDGVEIDAHRLYSNFYSRYEVAKYYTRNLKNINYISDDLLNLSNKYDYIIWFLPFVSVVPHKMWGLPLRYFQPEKMLNFAYSLLNENGQMFIVNQGKKEAYLQKELLQKLNINYIFLGEIKSEFFEYQNERYGYLIKA